jgi:hypothetical protein
VFTQSAAFKQYTELVALPLSLTAVTGAAAVRWHHLKMLVLTASTSGVCYTVVLHASANVSTTAADAKSTTQIVHRCDHYCG